MLALTLDVAVGIFHVLIKPIPLRVRRKLGNISLRGYLTGMALTWLRVFEPVFARLLSPFLLVRLSLAALSA